jgi:DNA-binding CsgD family transcriptional regulator
MVLFFGYFSFLSNEKKLGFPADALMASIEELVRGFLAQSPAKDRQDPEAEEILFDVEVDGLRYLFIRMAKPVQLHLQLSPREQEIVRLVALGHSNKIIAGVLNISSWTVCTHLRRIFAKLGVGSRAAMVALMPEIRRKAAPASAERRSSIGAGKAAVHSVR